MMMMSLWLLSHANLISLQRRPSFYSLVNVAPWAWHDGPSIRDGRNDSTPDRWMGANSTRLSLHRHHGVCLRRPYRVWSPSVSYAASSVVWCARVAHAAAGTADVTPPLCIAPVAQPMRVRERRDTPK